MARGRHYVYAVKNGDVVLYVGKGTGRRKSASARKHGGEAVVIEWFDCETEAFERERHWIRELLPENNICPGGNGGRCKPKSKYDIPKALSGKVSKAEWRRHVRESEDEAKEMARLGPRVYAARFLLRNIEAVRRLSKVDESRLREVAYG